MPLQSARKPRLKRRGFLFVTLMGANGASAEEKGRHGGRLSHFKGQNDPKGHVELGIVIPLNGK